jgi:hypothetical protein
MGTTEESMAVVSKNHHQGEAHFRLPSNGQRLIFPNVDELILPTLFSSTPWMLA